MGLKAVTVDTEVGMTVITDVAGFTPRTCEQYGVAWINLRTLTTLSRAEQAAGGRAAGAGIACAPAARTTALS